MPESGLVSGSSATLRLRAILKTTNFVLFKEKSKASHAPVPLHPFLAELMQAWKNTTSFSQPGDWVFASFKCKGKQPRVANMLVESPECFHFVRFADRGISKLAICIVQEVTSLVSSTAFSSNGGLSLNVQTQSFLLISRPCSRQ